MMKLDEKIFSCYKEIAKKLRELEKQILSHFRLNSSYHKVMIILDEYGELSQTELSDKCLIDKPAVSRIVSKMTNEGYIVKTSKGNNKKNIYIKLTEKSKELSNKMNDKLLSLKSKFFIELTEKDKNTFYNLLEKVLKKEEKHA